MLRAPYFDREVMGPEMLDRLGGELFAGGRPRGRAPRLGLPAAARATASTPQLRLELPFATKGEVSLKKIGLELVVRVGDASRTIQLPASMAGLRPASASFADGALVVRFEPHPEAVGA